MAKLTKAQTKAHNEAEAILTKDRLSDDERRFVFENWHEGANHNNGFAGAFFTPEGLAGDFSLDVGAGASSTFAQALAHWLSMSLSGLPIATLAQKWSASRSTPDMSRSGASWFLKPAGSMPM